MIRTLLLLFIAASLPQTCLSAVTFDWAYIGNAGNTGEASGHGAGGVGPNGIVGGVAYDYRISKYEVTNAQYVEFLNAVALTDSFSGIDPTLFDIGMGITRSGLPGAYSYAAANNMANKPVNYVSFFDAMRFTNWLHNGQGNDGTEAGVYTIDDGINELRSADAKVWIPSEDEWYKAAYHDATAGTAAVYFDYATRSNSVPAIATANSLGDIGNPGVNVANYSSGADWGGRDGNVTTVGSAGLDSASPYGTYDQSGNVIEWNETAFGDSRGYRGGSLGDAWYDLRAVLRDHITPEAASRGIGFRVATLAVPEPTALALAAMLAGYRGIMVQRRNS